jgi:sterol desaturase/sphingolipid hydroxylase (fatty acid hydroxylase superfamily)
MEAPTFSGVAIGFVILFVVFRALEWSVPRERRTPLLRKGLLTDIGYWVVQPFASHYVVGAVVLAAVAIFSLLVYGRIDKSEIMNGFGPLAQLPFWVQSCLILVLADFVGYWTHRAFHGGKLWKFHAIHHSSEALDWLSSLRGHPVNEILSRIATTLPLLALGFAPAAALWVAPVFALFAVLLHANLDWDWGPFRTVIASPRFHRWHHASEPEALDKNFAGLFPLWDILFGTYYMPKHRVPENFGTTVPVPDGLVGQFMFPFRKSTPP